MPDPHLLVQLRPARQSLVVALRGELDLASAPRVAVVIEQALHDGWDDLVLDLRGLSFIDSAGLHLLLDLRRRVTGDGVRCAISADARPVERLLAIAGLPDLLPRVHVDRLPA